MTDLESVPERTWILTGSPENHAATREPGFTLIGVKRPGTRTRTRVLMEAMGERVRTPA